MDADKQIMNRPFDSLAASNRGSAFLMAAGAACGAALALSTMYLMARFWIGPWLDALPERGTDMFGRPEGWLVAFAAVLFGPPFVVVAAWIGTKRARTYWSLDRSRPGFVRFAVLAFALGLLSFGGMDALGTGGTLAVVCLAVGSAGFVAWISSRARPSKSA